MLLYQQPVVDVDSAEVWVHRAMEARGWRHAENREFFTAPLHEIVALVTKAADNLPTVVNAVQGGPAEGAEGPEEEWTRFLSEGQKLSLLGMQLMTGSGGQLADQKRGFDLVCQAADVGEVSACAFAGSILIEGELGIPKNLPRAYAYLRKAIEAGDLGCHALLAQVFRANGQLNDAHTHWQAYFTHAANWLRDLPEEDPRRVNAARTAARHGRKYLELVDRAEIEDVAAPDLFCVLAPYIFEALQSERESLAGRSLSEGGKAILERNLVREIIVFERKRSRCC